jgi:hypothetical protein
VSSITNLEALKSLYKLSIAERDLEINMLVQRNNFFMIFQGVMFAGLLQAAGNGKLIPVVSFLICAAGFFAACFQVAMASGSKFWQERWQNAVEGVERRLLQALEDQPFPRQSSDQIIRLFSVDEENLQKIVGDRITSPVARLLVLRRFSTTRIPIYVGISFALVWLLLLFCQVKGPFSIPSFIVGFGSH